jgi:transcriptional regulator with XRE-family HTH domain
MIKEQSRVYFRALGKHIGTLRKGIGMTQAELARALGVSQQAVFAYELGDRRVSVFILTKLAYIFEISLEALSGMTAQPRPRKLRLSPACIRQAECLQQLSTTEQRFVRKIIQNLLEEKARHGKNPEAA